MELTDLQRALKQAWYEADKAVAGLVSTKPSDEDVTHPHERRVYNKKLATWHEEWYTALGKREGLEQACAIAKLPGFEE